MPDETTESVEPISNEAQPAVAPAQSEQPPVQPAPASVQPVPAPIQSAKPRIDTASLSPIERSIFLDAGENGVLLFRMADGTITMMEAMQRLGIDEKTMDELVVKLSGRYIFIESEFEKKEEIKIEKKAKEVIPIDVPKKTSADSVTALAVTSEITIRFGPASKRIYDSIDGKLDIAQLAADAMVSLSYVDDLMWFFAERKQLTFHRLKTEDVKRKYGSAGFAIYEEYGREGIYLFLLLRKTADPMSAIRLSDIEPVKSVDMMEFMLKQISALISFNKKDALVALKR